ncbi:MAG TPA: amino acid--tRNA ligase-related protein, partial [Vicinamibacterales bacterium]|nr:amino acid--tRNA ligase-related protein [Vicinamibacterales bacterium]
MSEDNELYRQRVANLAELQRIGVETYPRGFARTDTISALVAAHGERPAPELEALRPETTTAGRILAVRTFGKANFLVLSDGVNRIQAYIRQDSVPERDFAVFTLLDFGDFVGVRGRVFRTRTNELTIWASGLTFLAKCLRPLPEKWHGLQDVEIRYRQRYLDLIVNPDSRRVFEVRARVVAAIRRFLDARGFLEVETPMMQPLAGGALARPFVTHHNTLDMKLYLRIAPELYLKRLTVGGVERVFEIRSRVLNATRRFLDARGFLEVETPMMQVMAGGALARPFVTHHNALDIDLYLRVAPELYLKRLLVGGMEKVFEINRNFRNEGISLMHNPEFTMVEFYELYRDADDFMDLSEQLLLDLAAELLGDNTLEWQGHKITLAPPFR